METTTTPQPTTPTDGGHTSSTTTSRLERPRDGRVVAGVARALAERTEIPVGIVRLGFVVAAFFAGFGVLAYALGWMLLPSSDAPKSPAERWIDDVKNPDRRVGAVLIGLALAIVLVPIAPAALAAAVLIGGVGWILTHNGGEPATGVTPATDATPTEPTGDVENDDDTASNDHEEV